MVLLMQPAKPPASITLTVLPSEKGRRHSSPPPRSSPCAPRLLGCRRACSATASSSAASSPSMSRERGMAGPMSAGRDDTADGHSCRRRRGGPEMRGGVGSFVVRQQPRVVARPQCRSRPACAAAACAPPPQRRRAAPLPAPPCCRSCAAPRLPVWRRRRSAVSPACAWPPALPRRRRRRRLPPPRSPLLVRFLGSLAFGQLSGWRRGSERALWGCSACFRAAAGARALALSLHRNPSLSRRSGDSAAAGAAVGCARLLLSTSLHVAHSSPQTLAAL